jgi:hypothetical protein
MININKFAFCFFSSDVNDVIRQEIELTKLSNRYQIERWYRHDRNDGRYVSFSQMVNDAIDDTDSEFMIFCNPKTHFNIKDVEFIIQKLSNGYCFASVVSFGFFGFSKELIRQIGMLDERFINGEYEDDDFAIRLNFFNKAVCWGYDFSKYNQYHSKSPNLKHITHSIFNNKYIINDNQIIINQNLFSHKKISKRHREHNLNIYNSWLDSSHNYSCEKFLYHLTCKNIIYTNINKVEENIDIQLIIKKNGSNIFIELLSEFEIKISIVFLKNSNNERTFIHQLTLKNNIWHKFDLFDFSQNSLYCDNIEVRLFVDDNQFLNTVLNYEDIIDLKLKIPILVNK